jgi:hypothetical protein
MHGRPAYPQPSGGICHDPALHLERPHKLLTLHFMAHPVERAGAGKARRR